MEEWVKEMQLESSEAMRKLLQMTVFYGSMQEFMDILALGAEGDLNARIEPAAYGRSSDGYDDSWIQGAGNFRQSLSME